MISGTQRRYLAEFVGAFGIVFAPVALAGAAGSHGADSSLLAAALVSGLSVSAMIAVFGPISAAHFNPAVTLGFAVARRFPARHVGSYWASQLLGALAAAALCALLFGPGHGVHIPTISPWRAIVVEAALSFLLMLVIIAVATDRRVDGALPPIAIGLMVMVDVLIGGALTGGSMNPARSFGPAVFGGSAALSVWWIYILGPAIGMMSAAGLYELLRGGEEHSKGAPEE